jgi:hypothetical protein
MAFKNSQAFSFDYIPKPQNTVFRAINNEPLIRTPNARPRVRRWSV